jgi:hypothetical protein
MHESPINIQPFAAKLGRYYIREYHKPIFLDTCSCPFGISQPELTYFSFPVIVSCIWVEAALHFLVNQLQLEYKTLH